MIELGLSWWKSDDISIERYFKFIPSKYSSRIELQRSSEIETLENRLMGNETVHISDNSQLIRLRELEKDANLNDMLLVFDQCFKNSKIFNYTHEHQYFFNNPFWHVWNFTYD